MSPWEKRDYHQYGPQRRLHGQGGHWTQPRHGRAPPLWHSQRAMPCPCPQELPPGTLSALNLPTKQFQSVRSIAEPGAAGLTWGELVGSAEPLSDFRETNRPLSTSPLHTARESATNWTAWRTPPPQQQRFGFDWQHWKIQQENANKSSKQS